MNAATVKMTGIDQRHRPAFRLLAKGFLESKVHDASRRDGHAQRSKAGTEAVHRFLGRYVAGCGRNVDELLCVVWVNNLNEGNGRLGYHVATFSAAAGDDHFARLVPTLHRMENDVLLQHAVVAECGLSGFKHMEPPQFHAFQQVFAERSEVGSIAETPWRDPDELPARSQQPLNKRDKAGIEVAGFDADRTQSASLGRVGTDFAIRRIRDGCIEGHWHRTEQIIRKSWGHILYKISGMNGECESYASRCATTLTFPHGCGKCFQDQRIKLVECSLDGTNSVITLTQSRDERGGERACTSASIQQADHCGERPEHRSHEVGHRSSGEELS